MKRLPVILLGIGVSALAVLFTSLNPPSVSASPIDPGFDLMETAPTGTTVDLTGFGLGVVPLEGNPVGGALGTTDTIVLRSQGIAPFNPPGDSGVIDIELVALSLVSVSPVDLTPLGGPFVGVFSDLHITINKETEDIGAAGGNDDGVCDLLETCVTVPGIAQPDALAPSIGQMEVLHTVADGGTFDSCFGNPVDPGTCAALGVVGGGVFADSIFTVVGGDPNNPLDVLFSTPADRIALSGAGNPWSHNIPPLHPPGPIYPAGGFFVGEIVHEGPHGNLKPATTSIEVDFFPNSEAEVTINVPLLGSDTVTLTGPTTVEVDLASLADTEPNGREQVQTEMVQLELTGTSALLGPITVRVRDAAKHPFSLSTGEIEETTNNTPGVLDIPPFTPTGTADSFFDVFFELEAPGAPPELQLLHNDIPCVMTATITEKPPAPGEEYTCQVTPIPLLDENDAPTGVTLTNETHTPNPNGPTTVGGVEIPFGDSDFAAGQSASSAGSSAPPYAALAGAVAAAAVALAAGGWYARRRWLR